jgi:hypothetical protein
LDGDCADVVAGTTVSILFSSDGNVTVYLTRFIGWEREGHG